MTKILRYSLSLIALVLSAAPCAHGKEKDSEDATKLYPEQIQRQRLLERQKVFMPGQTDTTATSPDSVRALMDVFYADQFRTFSDPEAPYFMLMTKDAHLAMGMGGLLTVRGWEDWNGVVESDNFTAYNVPIPKDPARMKRLHATPSNSLLFLTLLGRNTAVGDFMAYLEGGFTGYLNTGFKIRRAYISMKGFTAGYALSTFLDVKSMPRMCDGGVYTGAVDRANVLVRYSKNFKSGWGVAGALEFPDTYVSDASGATEPCTQWLPDVVAFGQYQWDGGYSHVRLSGMLRTLSYRNLIEERNHDVLGWGVALSTSIKILPQLTFFGSAIYGAGHGSYISDLTYGAHDLVAVEGRPGELQLPKAFSYFAGLRYHFRPDLYAALTMSQVFNHESLPADGDGYHRGTCQAANLIWEITPRLSVGGEIMRGARLNFDGAHGTSYRAEAMLQLSF